MYEKNLNFLFKSMFLEKMVELKKKKKTSFVAAPPENEAPFLIDQTPSRISAIFQSLTY